MITPDIVSASAVEVCTEEWISAARGRWTDREHLRTALTRMSDAAATPLAAETVERCVFALAEVAERSAAVYESGLGLHVLLQGFLLPPEMGGVPVANPVACLVDGGPRAVRHDIVSALGLDDPCGEEPPDFAELDTAQGECLRIRSVGFEPLLGDFSDGSFHAVFCRVFHLWETAAPGVFVLLTTQLAGFADLAAYGEAIDDFARRLEVELVLR